MDAPPPAIRATDLVRLWSGGPVMLVECVEDDPGGGRAVCSWRGEDGELRRCLFPVPALRLESSDG